MYFQLVLKFTRWEILWHWDDMLTHRKDFTKHIVPVYVNFANHINGEAEKSRALTPLTKQVTELTITQFRGSQALDHDGTSRCYMHLSGESLFCKGKANGWVFGGTQLLDLCAFKQLCYFTALWSKLISASYVNENWYSSLCSYSFLIPIIDWNF